MNLEQFDEAFDTEFGEGDDAVVVEAVDPDEAILWLHTEKDVMKRVDVLAELPGDEIDGLDVGDLVDVPGATPPSRIWPRRAGASSTAATPQACEPDGRRCARGRRTATPVDQRRSSSRS